jgi:hypothetical protein
VLELLAGCDRILHAGDVGEPEILERLRRIAPVAAVRGNTDTGTTAAELPEVLTGDLEGLPFGMVFQGWFMRHQRLPPSGIPQLPQPAAAGGLGQFRERRPASRQRRSRPRIFTTTSLGQAPDEIFDVRHPSRPESLFRESGHVLGERGLLFGEMLE